MYGLIDESIDEIRHNAELLAADLDDYEILGTEPLDLDLLDSACRYQIRQLLALREHDLRESRLAEYDRRLRDLCEIESEQLAAPPYGETGEVIRRFDDLALKLRGEYADVAPEYERRLFGWAKQYERRLFGWANENVQSFFFGDLPEDEIDLPF